MNIDPEAAPLPNTEVVGSVSGVCSPFDIAEPPGEEAFMLTVASSLITSAPTSSRLETPVPAASSSAPGGTSALRLEHYQVLTREDGTPWELGRGAMGVTYKALDTRLHCHVALKSINAELLTRSPEVRERFLREARAAARLRHPNIASVFHLGETTSGEAFYAMEFIEGETLAACVRQRGPLPVGLVLEIGMEVARALVAAGQQGLIHRDLKPANLMLVAGMAEAGTWSNSELGSNRSSAGSIARSGVGDVRVKVIDFGLAKVAADSGPQTHAGAFLGTPQFASPEQFGDTESEADARSDIYSLGVTLWYALTGKLPFPGKSMPEVRARQLSEPLPLSQLDDARVPAPVAALLASMLAAAPGARPQTPHALLDSLRSCREQLHAPVAIGPAKTAATTPLQQARTGRKIPIAAGLALLAAVGVGVWWLLAARPVVPRAPDAPVDAAPVDVPEKSIAVLPFENLSADKENAFFTDGVQDEILTDLGKVADLKVISRTSVMPYRSGTPRNLRQITRELGVAHIVEGSVQRSGNRVRVSAQLIDARTDAHQWAEHYDRDLSDVFAIQSEIAQAIAEQLQAKLSPTEKAAIDRPPTSNVAAYDAYLQGKKMLAEAEWTLDEPGMRQAVRQLEDATARDPQFFQAWCELARTNLTLYWSNYDRAPERLARAETAVQAARRLQPEAGEAHLAEGVLLYRGRHDLPSALTEFQAAAHLLPNNSEASYWLFLVLRRQGQWEESARQIERATVLDPRNTRLWRELAEMYEWMYRYADAERAIDHARTLNATSLEYAFTKARCAWIGRADLEPIRRWLRTVPTDGEQWGDVAAVVATYVALDDSDYPAATRAWATYHPDSINYAGFIRPRAQQEGWIALLGGKKEEARTAFLTARGIAGKTVAERPDDAKALVVLAKIDSLLGNREDALREGRQACAMLPVSADAIDGAFILKDMAFVYAHTGEKDQAIEELRTLTSRPAGPSYGDLRLDHEWDPLRGDARFEALVAGLGPK